MNKGFFISSLFLILSFVVFFAFLAFGIRKISFGKKKRVEGYKVVGIFYVIIGTFISFVIFVPSFAYFYTEKLWYDEMGYTSVFWKMATSPWLLFLRFFIISGTFLSINFILASRLCPIPGGFQRWATGSTSVVHYTVIAVIIILSVIMGSVAIPYWDDYIRHNAREPFIAKDPKTGDEEIIRDPQFNKDVSYYLFTMPVRNFTSLWTRALFWEALIIIGLLYNFYQGRDSQTRFYVIKRGIYHLSFLWILLLISSIWRVHIVIHRLVFSRNGYAFGAGYTDVHIRIPSYYIYIFILGIIILLVLINSVVKKRAIVTISILMWIGSYIILFWIIPQIYQYIKVSPNEAIWEREYINRNIKFSRISYELNKAKVSEIVPDVATLEVLKKHPGTLRNVQLWDRRATRDTFNQTQVFLPYYTFWDVDADRYHLVNRKTGTAEYRQVMISARELDSSKLPSRTWVAQRLIYTHGYGLCLGPVNQFTGDGMPYLWIEGIPPVISRPEFKITRPEIYYGEVTKEYVIVKTAQMEFDYPKPMEDKTAEGTEEHYTMYQGDGGVPIGSIFNRILLAIRFHDFRIIVSEHITAESRIIFNRQISERANRLAPFLYLDKDPYIVIGDSGKLWWIIDAYTTSKHFPYSEPYYNKFNYIRNPLKAVIDAYNGKVDFYVWDEDEVINKVYRKAFPGLFKGRKEMPDGLDKHNRYPDDLSQIQAEMYCLYHMQDPQIFYQRSDRWDLPYEIYYQPGSATREASSKDSEKTEKVDPNQEKRVVPLYVMVSIPGKEKEEFVSIIPFTPYPTRKRPNMVAWMAIRNDEPNYGEILVYVFPKGKTIPGPAQVETRIDTNPEISEKLTLWNEGGSTVIRGNLLTLPLDNSLFYVEPLYLQSGLTQMPLLRQVIVAAGDKVAWGENFNLAVERIFSIGEEVNSSGEPVAEGAPTLYTEIVNSAIEKLSKYNSLIQNGNKEAAAKILEELKKDINELDKFN
ncbi:MAG: UPF0182 family protein [bacterium]